MISSDDGENVAVRAELDISWHVQPLWLQLISFIVTDASVSPFHLNIVGFKSRNAVIIMHLFHCGSIRPCLI